MNFLSIQDKNNIYCFLSREQLIYNCKVLDFTVYFQINHLFNDLEDEIKKYFEENIKDVSTGYVISIDYLNICLKLNLKNYETIKKNILAIELYFILNRLEKQSSAIKILNQSFGL